MDIIAVDMMRERHWNVVLSATKSNPDAIPTAATLTEALTTDNLILLSIIKTPANLNAHPE
jgi:hypothetical protein